MDGYELAKELNKWTSWDTSRDDIEALDEVDYLFDEAERAAEKAWVLEHDPQPPLPIGARIKEGVITGVCDYMSASYLVKEEIASTTVAAGS